MLSLQTLCTEPSFEVTSVPKPRRGPVTRPPAVAGAFYPGDPDQLARELDEYLANGSAPKEAWPAAMVPHAGWRYSGRVAGQVFRQLEIPDRVIVRRQ